jgi:alcohol dehydrogenase class IV
MPHGLCNAILLDHVVEYNFASEPEKYRKLGVALGASIPKGTPLEAAREETLNAIRSLKQSVGIKDNLCQLGMTEAVLPILAENALADACMLTNPKQPTTNELIELYRQAC